jgi:hypothetical protein
MGWGGVSNGSYYDNLNCWCTTPEGSYSDAVAFDCAPQRCQFPQRCVQATSIARNGTACVTGSEGVGCNLCSLGYYRFRSECKECPKDKGKTIILLVFFSAVVAYFGPTFAQLASPTVRTCLRNFLSHLQFLASALSINGLHWPPAFLRLFQNLKELFDGIQLAAPECVSASYDCACPPHTRARACVAQSATRARAGVLAALAHTPLRDSICADTRATLPLQTICISASCCTASLPCSASFF